MGLLAILVLIILIWVFNRLLDIKSDKVNFNPSQFQRTKCESPIERRLYDVLVFNNYYVETQYPLGNYRIDLAIPYLKLAIECDGKQYHSSTQQKAHDRRKDKYLRSKGWKVMRFTGRQINRNPKAILLKIQQHSHYN
ncbi:endonuclease domain-containing protein [Anaerobacillus sp. 1_MG-2023]|uniref:endonuclease domain-containing protein n=1 Tax=Anaerobacillus sp. 1_MG-2023 TaxID=3062655 RepID=UPI0026E48F9F|nr:DUF559 domain-containing protein [Anaerobacillus sp. 1_MG-2023]MDO6658005.1 DUF559 domain-containing protein [Anaerobacillus sp. 1_MG-2023]